MIKELSKTNVSYQKHYWTKEIKGVPIISALNAIKSNKYEAITNYLRSFYEKGEYEKYKIHKSKLPVVTFCGTFEIKRKKENIKKYNSIIVLDIDKLSQEELDRIKKALQGDKYVFSFWTSPSNKGIKGLVSLNYEFNITKYGIDASHKIAFNQLANYLNTTYNIKLDNSGSDITRLCFLSYDSQLLIKESIFPFNVEYQELKFNSNKKDTEIKKTREKTTTRNKLYNPEGKNNQLNKKKIKKVIKFLKPRKLLITNSYENWYRVAFAIANSFTYDIGLKYFKELCELYPKYNEEECEIFLANCYEDSKKEIKFNTIMYLAQKKGFVI